MNIIPSMNINYEHEYTVIHMYVVWQYAYVCVYVCTYVRIHMYGSRYSHYADAQSLLTPITLGQHLAMIHFFSVSLKNLKPSHGDESGITP